MADDNISFKLDLDAESFTEAIKEAISHTKELGESEHLGGLISGLTKAGIVAGTVGVAIFALKSTFEAVFDAEKINQTNASFELLAKNAGIAGTELKEGLVKAAA